MYSGVIGPVTSQFVTQARPAEQLHHHVRLPVRVDVEVEDADDVRVTQRRAGPALAQETLTAVAGRIERRAHHLDRDLVTEQRPYGPIHLAHATGAQLAGNLVAPVEKSASLEHVWAYKVLQKAGASGASGA